MSGVTSNANGMCGTIHFRNLPPFDTLQKLGSMADGIRRRPSNRIGQTIHRGGLIFRFCEHFGSVADGVASPLFLPRRF
jgi:hypothetical protein